MNVQPPEHAIRALLLLAAAALLIIYLTELTLNWLQ
jgi:hypothetical protein